MPLLSAVVSNVVLALVLALAAWSAQRWLRWPAVARVLWVLVLVKLVTPPLVSVPLEQSPGPLACSLGTCGCDHHSLAQTVVRDVLPWALLGVWATGAGTTAAVTWRRWARFRWLTAHADPAPKEWLALAARLTSELSLRHPPEVLAVSGRMPPLVVPGWRRPRVLLPTALLGRLNAPQKAALLLHELIHVKRGDHLVRLLEFAVGVAYWWLPGVGLIGRRLRACEEACCDAAVVDYLPQARRDYARLLLDVIDFTDVREAAPVTAMSAADDLEARLRAILDPGRGPRRTRLGGAVAAVLACAVLPCGLRYDFARPAATPAAPDPAAGDTPSPADRSDDGRLKFGCCPS